MTFHMRFITIFIQFIGLTKAKSIDLPNFNIYS